MQSEIHVHEYNLYIVHEQAELLMSRNVHEQYTNYIHEHLFHTAQVHIFINCLVTFINIS